MFSHTVFKGDYVNIKAAMSPSKRAFNLKITVTFPPSFLFLAKCSSGLLPEFLDCWSSG